MSQLNLMNSGSNTPQQLPPNLQLQDYDSFPSLQRTTSNPYEETSTLDPGTLLAAQEESGES